MRKKITKKQFAVIDDLFNTDEALQRILKKYKVSPPLYNRWQNDPLFISEFDRRIEQLHRSGKLLIAKYCSLAAAKLVSLTESENQETARKACLDIIELTKAAEQKTKDQKLPNESDIEQKQPLPPQLAEKILESLAQHHH